MKKPVNPCMNCELRNANCHNETCGKGVWLDYKKQMEIYNEFVNTNKAHEQDTITYMVNRKLPNVKTGEKK